MLSSLKCTTLVFCKSGLDFREFENSCLLVLVRERSLGVLGASVLWECFCVTFVIYFFFFSETFFGAARGCRPKAEPRKSVCSLCDCFSYFSTFISNKPTFFLLHSYPKKIIKKINQGFCYLNIKYNTKTGMELQNLVWNLCTRDKGYLKWQWFMLPIDILLVKIKVNRCKLNYPK